MYKWLSKKRNQKGFTLIELVVVIAILGILAAIAIPRLSGSRYSANKKSVEASLRTIDSAITIAEAEGITVTDLNSLVLAGYLASTPKNPDGGTYSVADYTTTINLGTTEAPNNQSVTVKRAKIAIATPGKFGLTGTTAIEAKTVEELDGIEGW